MIYYRGFTVDTLSINIANLKIDQRFLITIFYLHCIVKCCNYSVIVVTLILITYGQHVLSLKLNVTIITITKFAVCIIIKLRKNGETYVPRWTCIVRDTHLKHSWLRRAGWKRGRNGGIYEDKLWRILKKGKWGSRYH